MERRDRVVGRGHTYPLRNSAAIVERIAIAKMLSTMQHLAVRPC